MVQVDVFWAYGWGASMAVAAGPQLVAKKNPFENKYFVATLLFLSLVWAPTGLLLLLRHPSWETMQVAPDLASISEWIVLAFGITNVTQGILGFWVGYKLLQKGKAYWAHINWVAAYFGMFFILLYGWDGWGYDRFLYDRDMHPGTPAWQVGVGTAHGALNAFLAFFSSSVAKTLYLDGIYLLPPFFYLVTSWIREDRTLAPSPAKIICIYLAGVFLLGLGGAAFTVLVVAGVGKLTGAHILSYFIGIPLALAMLWPIILRPGQLAKKLLSNLDTGPQGASRLEVAQVR